MPKTSDSLLKRNLLTILTIFGVVAGSVTGLILRGSSETKWTQREIMYLYFPGELFLRMLKGLIIPLLMSSVIQAIGSLDLSLSKGIAIRSILYYSATTVCAVILGMILVVTIRPGVGGQLYEGERREVVKRDVLTQDTLLDLVKNLFPPNLVHACIAQTQTYLVPPENTTEKIIISSNSSQSLSSVLSRINSSNYTLITNNDTNITTIYRTIPKTEWAFTEKYDSTTNVLGLIVFSIVFGISVGKLGAKGKILIDFFDAFSEAIMIITNWVIWLSPIGVYFLVASKVLEIPSFADLVGRLGWYFITVLLGLFIHGFGTLPLLYFIGVRRLPFKFIGQLSQVCATAFGTSSSTATIPVTIQAMDKIGLDPRVTRFVIPIGATINMDGTALYEAVAAVFIAQLRNISLSFGQTVAVCVTATAASIGAAAVPQAGLITMVMVLDTIGLPSDEVINVLAVDWLLDRFRTTINVMCDCLCAKMVDILSEGELSPISQLDKLNAEPLELEEMTKQDNRL